MYALLLWEHSSRVSVPTTFAGAPTRSGPARRNGKSKACGGSKSRKPCRRNTASRRSARLTARSRLQSLAATMPSSMASTPNAPCWNWAAIDLPRSRPSTSRVARNRAICDTATWCRTDRSITPCLLENVLSAAKTPCFGGRLFQSVCKRECLAPAVRTDFALHHLARFGRLEQRASGTHADVFRTVLVFRFFLRHLFACG